MYAIVLCGGKQYKVKEGDELVVSRIEGKVGDKIKLSPVIFLSRDSGKIADRSKLRRVKVDATILDHFKDDKVVVFKYKPKKNYHRAQGHRQLMTRLKIEKIVTSAGKASAAEKKKAEPKAEVKKAPKKKTGRSKTKKTAKK